MEENLEQGQSLTLMDDSAHYLKNVMRRKDGSPIRVFNGRDGEFIAYADFADRRKSSLKIDSQIRQQTQKKCEIHLVFAPIKKDRMDFMIEKAVELGATHFHPVLTQQTAIRDINEDRLRRQITEAAEQCERLNIPCLAKLQKLDIFLRSWPDNLPLYAAIERTRTQNLATTASSGDCGLLIGPEGGFSDDERSMLIGNPKLKIVSFGEDILRAETAALYGLSLLKQSTYSFPS